MDNLVTSCLNFLTNAGGLDGSTPTEKGDLLPPQIARELVDDTMKRMGLYREDEKRMAAIEEDTYKRMKKARACSEKRTNRIDHTGPGIRSEYGGILYQISHNFVFHEIETL